MSDERWFEKEIWEVISYDDKSKEEIYVINNKRFKLHFQKDFFPNRTHKVSIYMWTQIGWQLVIECGLHNGNDGDHQMKVIISNLGDFSKGI